MEEVAGCGEVKLEFEGGFLLRRPTVYLVTGKPKRRVGLGHGVTQGRLFS